MSVHEEKIFAHITKTGPGFRWLAWGLALVCAWGVYAWIYQLQHGLGVTGLGRPTYWGLYITNFVFFVGVSHAGTLISAILRLSKAEWRRSITRMAELITVLVIGFGAANILFDLGRPERALYVFRHGNFRSPLLWDVTSISIYLTSSIIFLYLPLLPDMVRLRRHIGGWRGSLYNVLLFGYTDTPSQRRRLEKVSAFMTIIIVPIAVSVHTVISWIFAMTLQPMWHSTIFGPYFVAGAIFSGIATLLIFMVVFRKVFHLEDYLRPVHFDFLGKLFLIMALLWFYFTFSEYITTWYGNEPDEVAVMMSKLSGPFAPAFWTMVATCFVIPVAILSRKSWRSPTGVLIASIGVNIGMYLERYTIVVPTLLKPRISMGTLSYFPSWVEWSLLAACAAGFVLLYMLFTKIFPVISVWELEEGIESGAKETAERVATYYPE